MKTLLNHVVHIKFWLQPYRENVTQCIELEHLDGSSIALRFIIITIIKALVTNQAIVLNKGWHYSAQENSAQFVQSRVHISCLMDAWRKVLPLA